MKRDSSSANNVLMERTPSQEGREHATSVLVSTGDLNNTSFVVLQVN